MRPIFPLPSSKIRCIVFSGAATEHRAPRAAGPLLEIDTTKTPEKVGAGPTERLPGRRLADRAPSGAGSALAGGLRRWPHGHRRGGPRRDLDEIAPEQVAILVLHLDAHDPGPLPALRRDLRHVGIALLAP